MTYEQYKESYDAIMKQQQRINNLIYNQALEDLKFNLEEEKKAYAYNGYSFDTDKWLDSYLKSKLG